MRSPPLFLAGWPSRKSQGLPAISSISLPLHSWRSLAGEGESQIHSGTLHLEPDPLSGESGWGRYRVGDCAPDHAKAIAEAETLAREQPKTTEGELPQTLIFHLRRVRRVGRMRKPFREIATRTWDMIRTMKGKQPIMLTRDCGCSCKRR